MHWLHTLDTSLFLFINRSLVNPFFDWFMPVLRNNTCFSRRSSGVIGRWPFF